jgi:serine/threonine protein kinase/Tfp pilus assembly protein PilF
MSTTVVPEGSGPRNGSPAPKAMPPFPDSSPADELAGELAEQLAAAWRQGQHRPAEEFLALYPELADHPQAALRVVYEEVCLRQELGLEIRSEDIVSRFPRWQDELRVLLDCHRLFEPPPAVPAFPEAGNDWGDFQLVAELGRGARGRVFLATQPALADRPVVLKLTACTSREHLSLARLQHTGIVPLYFVQDDPDRNLRTLCMPYFGGLTLAQLLESLQGTPLEARSGGDIIRVLDQCQAASPVSLPTRGPARLFLAKASYVQAICWMGVCQAEALQYAHERGLNHLDIKPSNVLLATDGQPMLMDFHLAQAAIRPNQPPPAWVGGTLAYMPPEQQAAMAAVSAGQPVAVIVDGRADIYSLGALVYEALGGAVPFRTAQSPPLHAVNSQVSRGLSDLVGKCLALRAGDRYQDAASLAADLRRHLTDQRLRGVANRSWTELWHKWRRRRPHALRFLLLLAATLGLAITGAIFAARYFHQKNRDAEDRIDQARTALTKGKEYLGQRQWDRARDSFQHGLGQVKDNPSAQELARQLGEELQRAQRFAVAQELHRRLEQVRFLYGSDALAFGVLRRLEADCRAIWNKRQVLMERSGTQLAAEDEERMRIDLLDLAIMLSDLNVRLADGDLAAVCRDSLQVLDDAEKPYGPAGILEWERRAVALKLGDAKRAKQAADRAAQWIPQRSWEYCLLGRRLLRSRQMDQAAAVLQKAVDLEPSAFWPNYYQGVCAYEAGRYAEAVGAFRACISLQPRAAACFFNRGLAFTQLKQTHAALHDFAQALAKGFDPAVVHYRMAILHWEQRRDKQAARECLDKALKADPDHREARELAERLPR